LRNAALLEQMERMANTDGLTHIANRRTFEANLDKEMARSIRSGEPVSLVMLDIDYFKVLNDTWGHQKGDEVLREVAVALQAGSREFDTIARYGGEEFAVILPGTGPDAAWAGAQRLHRLVTEGVTSVPITVSLGVASAPMGAQTTQSLVKAADDALYQAKRAGRNRVSSADGGTERVGVSVSDGS
jgi:diguanylate cyclase (GGDEF)-like protein